MKKRLPVFKVVCLLFVTLPALWLGGCDDGPNRVKENDPSFQYLDVNDWIRVNMEFYYYWNDLVPSEAPGEIVPEFFFESMLHSEDEFSYMSDDAEALLNDVQGVSYTAGYSPAFGLFSGSNSVFIVVEFVYPGSPADQAGVQRGDIILTINGQGLTTENYLDLYYANGTSTLGLGIYNEQQNSISQSNITLTVDKAELNLDPVVYKRIYNYDDHKIGYMFYAGFVNGLSGEFITSVNNTFSEFADSGVTELVVDLRYNPGGSVIAAQNISSGIVPMQHAVNEDILVTYQYNPELEQYLVDEFGPDNENLYLRFEDTSVNMGLDKVYFIQTGGSASASELIINGLAPYMDVYGIGSNTYGKFYGSFVISGLNADPPLNYAIVPVSLKYANALGVTDFRDGLAPDFEADENIFAPYDLGDVNDPFLSVAIEHITTGSVTAAKTLPGPKPYTLLPDPYRYRIGNVLKVIEE